MSESFHFTSHFTFKSAPPPPILQGLPPLPDAGQHHPPTITHIGSQLDAGLLQTAPSGPLAHVRDATHTPAMALYLTHLTGQAVPGHTVQRLPTHVTIGGA